MSGRGDFPPDFDAPGRTAATPSVCTFVRTGSDAAGALTLPAEAGDGFADAADGFADAATGSGFADDADCSGFAATGSGFADDADCSGFAATGSGFADDADCLAMGCLPFFDSDSLASAALAPIAGRALFVPTMGR